MMNRLEYKGYYASIEIDFAGHELYGRIEDIHDLVNFMSGIEQEFHSAVDDYLEFCKEVGKEPETPEQHVAFA